jgi:hypothetical protein
MASVSIVSNAKSVAHSTVSECISNLVDVSSRGQDQGELQEDKDQEAYEGD